MEIIIGIIIIIFIVAIGIWFAWGLISPYIWEQPEYEVLNRINNVEIRRYKRANVITTRALTSSNAFSVLASYIFGKNAEQEKIAMTAPVVTQNSPDDKVKMMFYLPKKYKESKIPSPLIEDISIETQEEKLVAIWRFYGRLTNKKVKKCEQKLNVVLQDHQIPTIGNFFSLGYSDPFVPPPLRRNEVGIEIQNVNSY